VGGGNGRTGQRGDAALRVAVLVSGEGTNLQALLDDPGVDVVCVASSRAGAGGLRRAREADVPAAVVAGEDELAAFTAAHAVELVVLAGWMRVLSAAFLARFPHRVVNVHPSLLPAFPGAHAVEDALAYGVRVTGVTVHLVDEGVDTGPVILQEAVTVPYTETPSGLLERLHRVEHRLLPEAVRLIAAGRVQVEGRQVRVTGRDW
jgi:phosphoribosylglycinamide formyltransferase-1